MRLRPTVRRKVALRYVEVYQTAHDAQEVPYKRVNCGRFEANTRLRKFVKDHGQALQGYTAKPPLTGAKQRS